MENERIDTVHIDVLDGIRAYSVIFVMLFHFWQQSWLNKTFHYAWFDTLGIKTIDFDWLCRTGYVFVDMMILLSGFLLFLPHARHMVEGSKLGSNIDFYKKRLSRILPSYYFCIILLLFVFVLPLKDYWTIESLKKDLFAQLTFTQMFDPATKNTRFNGVLWTVAVEVQFYIIFPLVAYFFRKKPVTTYISMITLGWLYIRFRVLKSEDLGFMINQMPAFLGVYANGMMGSLIYVNIANRFKRDKYLSAVFTVMSLLSIYMIRLMLEQSLLRSPNNQVWQVEYRYLLSLVFITLVISLAFSAKWLRFIFANRIARFLSAISFNLYIWHQMIAVKFKYGLGKDGSIKIPEWEGEKPPNMLGDAAWQWEYVITITAVSLIVATAMTYLFEKPMADLILGKRKAKKRVVKPVIEEETDIQATGVSL